MADVYQIVYSSRAAKPLAAPELTQLLQRARRKNAAAGLTGLLLYKDGLFLQVLEGDAAEVTSCYGRILKDPRHGRVNILRQGFQPARSFPAWSMGLLMAEAPAAASVPGLVSFFAHGSVAPEPGAAGADPNAALEQLLSQFRRGKGTASDLVES